MKIAYLIRNRPDLADKVPADVEPLWIQAGEDGVYADADLAKLGEVDAFVIGMEPVHAQILAAAPNLKIVQRLGVGYETLNLKDCAAHGVPACNIEGVNKEAVAEHAMMFMLSLSKKLLEANAATQAADWLAARRLTPQTFELKDKTLGIIGFGNTGSQLALRARAFEMNVLYNDPLDVNDALAASIGARKLDKAALLAQSDFVSICTDLNDTSRGMIDAQALARMQPHAMFICCARGGIVDEPALAQALKSGQIAAAAIDVFESEPLKPDNPLIGLDNCLLTAHVAGVASDTTERIWQWAHDNVRAVVQRQENARWVRNSDLLSQK
ncbi:MAG: NAD(P)-dependent oxidoreductase [Burkholderiaceae bacterium]